MFINVLTQSYQNSYSISSRTQTETGTDIYIYFFQEPNWNWNRNKSLSFQAATVYNMPVHQHLQGAKRP